MDRVDSVVSLLFAASLSLDSLAFEREPTRHNTERTLAAKTSLNAAVIEMRSLGVALTA